MKFIKFSFSPTYMRDSIHKINPSSARKRNIGLFLVVLSLLFYSVNQLPNNLIDPFSYKTDKPIFVPIGDTISFKDTQFDPTFPKRFNTVSSIVYYVNKHLSNANDEQEKIELLAKIIRKRFHHAYAVYGIQENWIAVLAGRFIWRNLAAKVIPDEILLNEVAACSQVSIVMMACCAELGLETRRVELVGHYTLEVKAAQEWYFVDANIKPNFDTIGGRKSLKKILEHNEQYALYANTVFKPSDIKEKFSEIYYGNPNENPAPQAYVFQVITGFLSHWSWLILLIIGLACQLPKS